MSLTERLYMNKILQGLKGRVLASFPPEEKVAVVFESSTELQSFLSAVWHDEDFKRLPRRPVDKTTYIIPREALPALREKGIKFTEQPVAASAGQAKRHVKKVA
jgi:hypothetical protein